MRRLAIVGSLLACSCCAMPALAGKGGRTSSGAGAPVQVDNSLRTPAFQPQGPDFFISAEDHGVIGPGNRNAYFSFSRFDVPRGGSATFASGTPVRNVLARVTGDGSTTIDGTLRVSIPGANFFLVNPNGIVVTENASFDLPGSLVLTTADELRFGDATFSARGGGNPAGAVLSSANPTAFGFLGNRAPAKIAVSGLPAIRAPLQTAGKSVSLVGGEIAMEGATLNAPAGRINLVAVRSGGEVRLDAGLKSQLSVEAAELGDVTLAKQSKLDLGDGGNLFVRARDLTLDQSTISGRSQQTPGKKDIRIDLSGALSLVNQSNVDADTFGPVEGARITIDAAAVRVANNSRIQANVGTPNNDGLDPSLSAQNALATGRAGNIRVHADTAVTIEDLGFVSSFAFGPGRGADIDVVAPGGRVVMTGPAADPRIPEKKQALFTGVIAKTDDQADASQSGGRITVRADVLELRRGADLASTTKTARDAGDVFLNAREILVDGTGRQSLTGVEARAGDAPAATGRGGDIRVYGVDGKGQYAQSLTIVDGGALSASTFGQGRGGDVYVNARRVRLEKPGAGFTGLFARSAALDPGPAGDAGGINVDADSVVVKDGASISASSRSPTAVAGSVTLNVRDELTLDGGTLGAAAKRGASAGDVDVRLARSVVIKNGSSFTTETRAAGAVGGNILIQADGRVIVDHSILTAASLQGSGKTLTIDPPVVALNAAVINGQDLNRTLLVTIDATQFVKTIDTQILTNRPPDLPPDINIAGQLVPLQVPDFGAAARLMDLCPIRLRPEAATSSFLITGRGGTPVQPGGAMPDVRVGPGGR